jgi:hypothetical protein
MMSEEASDRLSSTEDNDYYHGKEGENGFLKAVIIHKYFGLRCS